MLALLLAAAAPILPTAPTPPVQEQAGQQTVLAFRHLLLDTRDPRAAAQHYLANDFRNHDPAQPSGAQAYAEFAGRPGALDAIAAPPILVLTQGELTMLACQTQDGRFASTLYQVRHGRILQIWSSGPAAPIAAPAVPIGAAPPAVREANTELVEAFVRDYLVRGNHRAADRLAPDIVSHVPGVPSGAGFVEVGRNHPERLTAPGAPPELFAIAAGDLVTIGFSVPYASDLGARYAQNIARVRNGKIVEWWYSGLPRRAK